MLSSYNRSHPADMNGHQAAGRGVRTLNTVKTRAPARQGPAGDGYKQASGRVKRHNIIN